MEIAAAAVVMYVEDLLNEDDPDCWESVTVNIDEYARMGDPSLRRHFRLTKPMFEILYNELGDLLKERGRVLRERRPFDHMLLMVLWVLGTPDSFRSVTLRFGVSPSEVHDHLVLIIERLCDLGERYIRWPDEREREEIQNRMEQISGFPGIVGIIDGKHFSITRPLEEPAAYRNRHHGHSVLAQVVCDDRLMVRDLYVGEAGSLHDARVFRRSPLFRRMLVPPRQYFSRGEHIIGDSSYPLMDRVLVPLRNNGHLTARQRNFNRCLSKVRVRVEQTFGRATGIWRRSQHMQARNMEYIIDHIGAVFVLHNFRVHHGLHIPLVEVNFGDLLDEEEPAVADEGDDGAVGPVVNDHDPHVYEGDGGAALEIAHIHGEQKRWDICNALDILDDLVQ